MPALGQSIVEGTVAQWLVQPGDTVQRDQALCVVETDKATTEVPAPRAGVVGRILVAEGATVAVSTALCEIVDEGEVVSVAGAGAQQSPESLEPGEQPTRELDPPVVRTARAEAPTEVLQRPRVVSAGGGFASPAVRRLSREHGIDIGGIRGTGRNGRVTRDDLLAYLAAHGNRRQDTREESRGLSFVPRTYRIPMVEAGPEDEVVPMTRRRRIIAEHMVYSNLVSPHVAAVAEVDLHRVQTRRGKLKAGGEATVPGVLAHVAVATVQALKEHRVLNSAVDGERYVLRGAVNLGVAVQVDAGLVVPVVHRAGDLDAAGLHERIAELAERARNNRLTADDLTGGTFTISNPGRAGNLFGISLLNQPQVGILRMGEIVKRPVVLTGADGVDEIVVRPMMYLCLSYDHRVVDGAVGNAFLRSIKDTLEAWPIDP